MKDRDYVDSERREYARRLVEIERAPKADKLEAAAEFAKALTEHPWVIVERMRWMLEGHYGYGAAEAANRVLTASKKANKKAMLFQMIGRLEWSCPVYCINKAWKGISAEAQAAVKELIDQEIAEYMEENLGWREEYGLGGE